MAAQAFFEIWHNSPIFLLLITINYWRNAYIYLHLIAIYNPIRLDIQSTVYFYPQRPKFIKL